MWLREDPSVDLLRFPVLVCRALPLFLPTSLQSESALRTVRADTRPFWSKYSHTKHVLSHPFIHKVTREYSPSPSPILSVFPWVFFYSFPSLTFLSIHLIVPLSFQLLLFTSPSLLSLIFCYSFTAVFSVGTHVNTLCFSGPAADFRAGLRSPNSLVLALNS